MRRLGGSSYKLAETQRPRLAREGLGKQPLLPSEKEARGSYKEPGELLIALSLRAEARGPFLQPLTPRGSEKCDKKGAEPVTVQGFEGWTTEGFDSHPRTTESWTTMGEPVYGRGPSKRSPGMP